MTDLTALPFDLRDIMSRKLISDYATDAAIHSLSAPMLHGPDLKAPKDNVIVDIKRPKPVYVTPGDKFALQTRVVAAMSNSALSCPAVNAYIVDRVWGLLERNPMTAEDRMTVTIDMSPLDYAVQVHTDARMEQFKLLVAEKPTKGAVADFKECT